MALEEEMGVNRKFITKSYKAHGFLEIVFRVQQQVMNALQQSQTSAHVKHYKLQPS